MHKHNKKHRTVRKHKAGPNFSGQHLLHNPRTIRKLIDTAQLHHTDTVLEIGAGRGNLTFPIAERSGKVIAVEYDAELVRVLRAKAEGNSRIHIVHDDIRRMRLPKEPFSVVANIPFSITTVILDKLLGVEGAMFQKGALILEKGAAQRFTQTATRDPRLLMWSMCYTLEMRMVIPRDHFAPPPRVDAAILRIFRRERPLIPRGRGKQFQAFAAHLLREPRLTASDALRGIFTPAQLRRTLSYVKVDREQSVAALSLEQWAGLYTAMLQHVDSHRWPRG